MRARRLVIAIVAVVSFFGPLVAAAPAQDTLGGHIGFVLPLATRANGTTSTISDDFVIGFPTGITVRRSQTFAFDLELLPVIQNDPLHVDLTLHPGVVWGLRNGWGAGARLAFDVNKASWGFTPILNHGLLNVGRGATLFGELVLPIRFQDDGNGTFTSIGVGVHIGVGF